jgi:hypothetical protein
MRIKKGGIEMPYFIGFALGAAFMYLVTDSTHKKAKETKEELDDILDDRQKLINEVDKILLEKEMNGELEILRRI